ncbi:MAG: hypothetical protein ACREBU_00440 [Nitrososphaera sp.]
MMNDELFALFTRIATRVLLAGFIIMMLVAGLWGCKPTNDFEQAGYHETEHHEYTHNYYYTRPHAHAHDGNHDHAMPGVHVNLSSVDKLRRHR